jgi:hypothetical protein
MSDNDDTILTPALRKFNRRALNAVKHGGFSTLTVLPSEDLEQFKELCTDLENELKPSGRLEIDAVITIAKLVWRKSNLNVFRRAEKARQMWAPYLIEHSDEHVTIDVALKARLQAVLQQLTSRLERVNEESELGPGVEKALDATKKLVDLDRNDVDLAKLTVDATTDLRLALWGDEITPDSLNREQEMLARLDAGIDRTLKRLWQLKAAKQNLRAGY